MSLKRIVARSAAVVLAVLFTTSVSVGAYYDVGGWPGVAVVWAGVAVLVGLAYAFVWALENWNAS